MNSEEYKEKLLDAGDSIMPHLFQKLIENGKFDIEKKCEINYIKSILQDSSILRETLSEIRLSITIYKEFIELAKHSVEINKISSAIILLATTIEHQFNFFYGEIFINLTWTSRMFSFSCLESLRKSHQDSITFVPVFFYLQLFF